ncbi:hypothetical protein SAMN06297387_106143 [Streptomyces zhaozhouensis]|uniref:Uncharacterized protein n=1 Tax=Streptomyces zhaozhouensis TaxID=1300267 RepID=A0A286DV85_9ACTN|nr:hypothetical protein [Streptomyces zhaozhouensis]SOD62566.1 hypothetical protein SAMN06297387_106143 [Streptomyces zhaozhouensis]
MTATQNDRRSVRIGGDAHGPVVVGDGNHVSTQGPPPPPTPEPVDGAAASGTQTNTAHQHGTVYAVTGGDMHIHQNGAGSPSES